MNGSPDTSRSGEPRALDDLPPGIAWLRGPQRHVPGAGADAAQASGPAGQPALRPGQVVTWLPDGRWVTDADEDDPVEDQLPETGRRGRREGRDTRGRRFDARGRAGAGASDHADGGSDHAAEPGLAGRSDLADPGRRPWSAGGATRSGGWHLQAPGRGPWGHGRAMDGGGSDDASPGRGPWRRGVAGGVREGTGPPGGRTDREAVARRGRRRIALARAGARLGGWPRRVVIGILLVAAAALALRPQPPPAPAETGPTEPVVVAARDLAAGTELAAGDLRIVSMPIGIVPVGSSRRAAGLIGRVAAGAVRRGEALTDARVVGPGLAAGLAPGEAAVPVRIADPDTAALVRVGDRVDVLGTPVAPDGTQATAGEIVAVASAVRVLAVLRSHDPADGLVLVVATGQAAARTLAGAAVRHRLTVNVRPP